MILKLSMTNFKKHENLTLEFTEGLVALRGANEAGKSTAYHAITYALFGSRALPLPLAETVTYGKPESSLKVVLDFKFDGALYHIQRSKSGATLTTGATTVNGQAEVTKYVEALLRVNADTAGKLMIASQNALRGALEGNGAISLIEKLSNLDLIDSLISKVQDQLPCGNTKALVESLEGYRSVVAPVNNLAEFEPEITATKLRVSTLSLEKASVASRVSAKLLQSYTSTLDAERLQSSKRKTLTEELQNLDAKLASPLPEFNTDIDSFRWKQQAQIDYVKLVAAYKLFSERPIYTVIGHAGSPKELAETDQEIKQGEETLQALRVKKALATSLKITDKECGLCGKLLQDVPEVLQKNAKVTTEVARLVIEEAELLASQAKLLEKQSLLREIKDADIAVGNLHARLSPYVEKDDSVPAKLTWVGEVPGSPDSTNYTALIKAAEAERTLVLKAQAARAADEARRVKVQEALDGLSVVYDVVAASAGIAEQQALQAQLQELEAKLHHAQLLEQTAVHKLDLATLAYTTAVSQHEDAQSAMQETLKTIKAYERHNALIKKLREARPIIATRLWGVVLASITHYFSQIRGVPSAVTRQDDKFLIDGRPVVGGVSGSTLDSLGLAVRMALGKTFLPSVRFLLLDEPAAGMDDERESAMLGLLAATGFDQVILVTHSELADSFATSVVQL